ncbi:putative specificity protein s [Sulfuritalea hydrogenivorans sk43H]|uniref:Putative specificity protein s n=2 Tax=Sulfuritalea hydrogenivorans TaxID=748811 RepID=W0SFA3_9PROT|nr:putative specificity protein s [Sulfuritalea hydrogenivorans sk43H]
MARMTTTGGRDATTAVIPGRFALSVGKPDLPTPPGWSWTPVSFLARLESGHTPSRTRPEYWGGDVPWIGIRDATGNHGRVLADTEQHTNQLGINNSSARILPEGTVCLSRTASVGYVVVMGRPMATSQDFANWVCGEDLNPHFLKYVLLAERDTLHMYATGTTHQTIYYPELKAFHICVPDRKQQDAIVAVLFALDRKIELNRKMNEKLETMGRSLFKDWFIDFGPVRAKMEGRLPPGLAPEIAALFPEVLDAEGKPAGWSNGSLDDIADLNPESWSKKNSPTEIDYVDLSNTKWGVIELTTRFAWADAPSRAQRILRPGDTIVGTVRPGNGSYSYVSADGLTGSTGFAVLRPKDDDYRELLYFAATSLENIERLSHLADGGAYPAVRPEAVFASPIVRPEPEVVTAFSSVVAPLIRAIEANKHEAAALASLRDLLLPKLLSGEARVGGAEHVIGDTA